MSRNNFIAVAKYNKKYYIISNLNMDTQYCAKYIYKVIKSGEIVFIKDRGNALCLAHDIQFQINTEYGVIEFNIDELIQKKLN